MRIQSSLAPIKVTEVYDTYWRFAAERQAVFFRKIWKTPQPWTQDRILTQYKFTNAYRASDRVSQYLIRRVIYAGDQTPEELLFRILIFKTFNRISTWEMLERSLSGVRYHEYDFDTYDRVLSEALEKGECIYSGAYIMTSGRSSFGYARKHRNHLQLIDMMLREGLAVRIVEARRMQNVFDALRGYPTIGDFLAYQYTIDINYSMLTNFSETEFVVPGPGALDGISKCFSDFGGLNEVDLIKLMADSQEIEFDRLGLDFQNLWGRRLQLIDCQNLFCEVDKYARVAHPGVKGRSQRQRIKRKYVSELEGIDYWYPPKWGLNEKIDAVGEKGCARQHPKMLDRRLDIPTIC